LVPGPVEGGIARCVEASPARAGNGVADRFGWRAVVDGASVRSSTNAPPKYALPSLLPQDAGPDLAVSFPFVSEGSSREQEWSTETGRRPTIRLGSPLEFLVIPLLAFALAFGFVKPVVANSFRTPTESMVPTIGVGDRTLVNKLAYEFGEPERGDIVVFGSAKDEDQDLVKRVVGLPGDVVTIEAGRLLVNGAPREEPYLADKPCVPSLPKTCRFGPVRVPKGHVFVMGDNRTNSRDSRFFGPVPEEKLVGEAVFRFWPPGRVGTLLGAPRNAAIGSGH
jgi:signal peptidase I